MLDLDASDWRDPDHALTTALALSMTTGRGFKMTGLDATPGARGLARRHLSQLEAARALTDAHLEGASPGAARLRFTPGPPQSGRVEARVGAGRGVMPTARALLPAMARATGACELILEGATHTPDDPPIEHLALALAPLYAAVGVGLEVDVARVGFAPAGGGRVVVRVTPPASRRLAPLTLEDRNGEGARVATALTAHAPEATARRMLARVETGLGWTGDALQTRVDDAARSPGVALLLTLRGPTHTTLAWRCGQADVRPERLADAAISALRAELAYGAPVGPALADDLVRLLAADGDGCLRAAPPSPQLLETLALVARFSPGEPRARRVQRDRRHQWLEVGRGQAPAPPEAPPA